jgi:hypothetical protein
MGDVKVSISANQAAILVAAGNAFTCNFVDLVNAPAQDFAVVLDPDGRHISLVQFHGPATRPLTTSIIVTFYKIAVKTFEASWKAGQAALLVRIPKGIKLDRNDLGTNLYKRVTSLHLPGVSVKILLTGSRRPKAWLEAAEISSEAYIDIYSSPYNHQALTRAQLAFIEEQDSLTGRAKRILEQLNRTEHSKFQSRTCTLKYRISWGSKCFTQMAFLIAMVFIYLNPVYPVAHLFRNVQAIIYVLVILALRPRAYRHVPNLSDTDAEEGVSEADRDARLA